jgi:LDH2 family malate/lactate/ureidoglycolate dehydrogenase
VRHSNHFGIAGWYALRAAEAGLIGISLTNASPLVAPTRAIDPLLGTNPIAVAAPAGKHGTFCLDMATSTIPRGRIEVAARRGESLQPGWAIDAEGRPATTPEAALAGALMPLGGSEETGGYKGYGLTLLVDILTGVLAGGTAGPSIVPLFSTHHGAADVAQTFIVIDPGAIAGPGEFVARMEAELDPLVTARTAPGAAGRVLIPGEPEQEAERRSDERGIILDRQHHESLLALARRLEVDFPATRPL